MADRWQRPKAAWREDEVFCEEAKRIWPEDYARAQEPGYDRGGSQKLSYRYQGWIALARKMADAQFEEKLHDAHRQARDRKDH